MTKTYSEVNKRSRETLRKKLGEQGFKEHMGAISRKRWAKCECGHSFAVHDGACCSNDCTCRCFRGVV